MTENNKAVSIAPPLTAEQARKLKAGDKVLISGVIYTGIDAAHQRMIQALDRGEKLPFDVKNQIIYFMGPSPAPEGKVIGSAGPTTSGRMDAYSPRLIACGLTGMIGKGLRSRKLSSNEKYGAVYFGAIGELCSVASRIKEAEVKPA
jgi:fumarate hydratase subunit beta